MDPQHFETDSFVNEEVIQMVVDTISKSSAGWMEMFTELGLIIFTVIAALEFMKEALNIAQGKEHNLAGKLIRYAMVGVLVATASSLVKGFKEIPLDTLDFMDYNRAKAEELGKQIVRIQQDQTILEGMWSTTKNILMGPIYLLGQLFYFIASVVTTMVYAAYSFMFNVVLSLAPIAFPFLLSDDLKEIFTSWITNVISYSITFPLIAIGINIIMHVQGELLYQKVMAAGDLNFIQIAVMSLIVSMTAFGVIMAAAKTAKHLTGAGGGGGTAVAGFAMAVGVAMSAMKLSGSPMKGKGTAAGAATVSNLASTTMKAAASD